MPLQTRPEYEMYEAGNVTKTTLTQDTVDDAADVTDYKHLIGIIHRVDGDLELYKTIDLLKETFLC